MENETLSPKAEEIIEEMEGHYSLTSEQFKLFFLMVYGKPKPRVLPIVSSFTEDVDEVILQLKYFESSLREAHAEYMAEHDKDQRLTRMVAKLVAGLQEEMRKEEKERQSQRSISQYLLCQKKKFTAGKINLSSLAEQKIKGMITHALKPEDLKKILYQVASGKPKSKILPILRSLTGNEQGAISQLGELRNFLRGDHRKYMSEHEKDKNVLRRINVLIKNIEKEQVEEARKCRGQKSMRPYALREKNI